MEQEKIVLAIPKMNNFDWRPSDVDQHVLAICSDDNICLWDVTTASVISTIATKSEYVNFSRDGRRLVSRTKTRNVYEMITWLTEVR